LQAVSPANLVAEIGTLARANGTGFDLAVVYNPSGGAVGVTAPVILEQFTSLTFSSPSISTSQFVTVAASTGALKLPSTLTLPSSYPSAATKPILDLDGSVLNPNTAAFENRMLDVHGDGSHGVYYLQRVDIFNLLCVPGETAFNPASASVLATLQGFCVAQRAFLIVDSDQNDTHASLLKADGPSTTLLNPNATNSAFYFPWIQAPDPLQQNRIASYPPSGFVAGLYAATDAARHVWKAPAGIEAGLTGASGLTAVLTDLENGDLNIRAINCLRSFRVYGNVIWGARTLQGNDQLGSQWKYVSIRRFALFLESSLYDGMQWVVFEPNDETLWGQIRLNVGSFMQQLFLQQAFQGSTPQQAYFVKCDSENNPQSSINLGIVNVLVGFAPLYPAEFVVIQIQQMAGQL
jgi:phage tail sheath protein FI